MLHSFIVGQESSITLFNEGDVDKTPSLCTGDSVIICLTLIHPGNSNPLMPAVSPSYWSCVLTLSQSPSMLVQCGRKLSHDDLQITGYPNTSCTMMRISYSLIGRSGTLWRYKHWFDCSYGVLESKGWHRASAWTCENVDTFYLMDLKNKCSLAFSKPKYSIVRRKKGEEYWMVSRQSGGRARGGTGWGGHDKLIQGLSLSSRYKPSSRAFLITPGSVLLFVLAG